MEEVLLSALGVAAGAVVLIETLLIPNQGEKVRIPDDDTERYLKDRSDRYFED
jgi:hypothetical protein